MQIYTQIVQRRLLRYYTGKVDIEMIGVQDRMMISALLPRTHLSRLKEFWTS